MYTFKEIKDSNIWNSFLHEFSSTNNQIPRYTFFQSFEWGEFHNLLDNKIYRVGVFKNGKVVGLAMCTIINARRGKYLHVRHGPVFDWSNFELAKSFLNHIKNYAKKHTLWFVRISPLIEKNTKAEENYIKLTDSNTIMNDLEGTNTWVMEVPQDTNELFKSIRKKTRYEIRKAEKVCNVLITQDNKDLTAFFEIEKDTIARNNWIGYSHNYIKNEFNLFSKLNKAHMILVSYKNTYIAGGIFISDIHQMYYHYGATRNTFRDIPGSYLMIWEALKLARKKNIPYFNFWGIVDEHASSKHPWQGLTKFKKKFPGVAQNWVHSREVKVSLKQNITRLYDLYNKYSKGH